QRVFPHAPLFEGPFQQDFPAAAADPVGGGVWVVAVWHEPRGPELLPAVTERLKSFAELAPTGGGDQIRLIPVTLAGDGPTPGAPGDVTEPGGDRGRPSGATDSSGGVIAVWSENRDGNWDLYSRRYDSRIGAFGAEQRLTADPGPDCDAVLVT